MSGQSSPRKRKRQAIASMSSRGKTPAAPSKGASPERAKEHTLPMDRLRAPSSTAAQRGRANMLETPSVLLPGHLIDTIIENWRRRQMWHRAEKSLTLQAKGLCRRLAGGDKDEAEAVYKSSLNGATHPLAGVALAAMTPLLNGRDVIEESRKQVEKILTADAKRLAAWSWADPIHGFGALSLAGIVGEAGDLSKYGNPAKLWKRMGLAVINGGRQRRVSGDEALEHGYSPMRRSLMWTIGDCIVKVGGPYREVYDQRKAYENEKNERGEYAERAARALREKKYDKKTAAFKAYSQGKLPPGHIHASAKRYIEKRLLRDLWRAWRDQAIEDAQRVDVSPNSLPVEPAARGHSASGNHTRNAARQSIKE